MGKQERRAYLEAIRVRYRRARKAGKSAILNEFCAVCGYHRKYALRLLGGQFKRSQHATHKPGPVSRYDTPELVETLRTIWMTSDQLCSKRLKAALPLWLPHYETSFHPLTAETLARLDSISAATIDRLLKPWASQYLKDGVTLEQLDAQAAKMRDNDAALALNNARKKLFKDISAAMKKQA